MPIFVEEINFTMLFLPYMYIAVAKFSFSASALLVSCKFVTQSLVIRPISHLADKITASLAQIAA